jgi:signal transduction histidine kinase
MRTLMLIALVAGALLLWRLARAGRRPIERDAHDWLPAALRDLAAADGPRAIEALLSHHLELGLGASHVEWWRRDEDGTYHSRHDRIDGADAGGIDAWVAAGATWRSDAPVFASPDAERVLAATGANVVAALHVHRSPVGFLVLGARTDARPYDAADLARIEALAHHVVLITERVQTALLDESRRMLQRPAPTVGTLAAELAHEIRNPLVAVQTFLQLLPERLDDPEVTNDLRGVALTSCNESRVF